MAGIYKITNLKTNDFYIGSTTQSFLKRKRKHFDDLKNQRHKNHKLQNSFNNLGKEFLHFEILEECLKHQCIEREQHYINVFSPYYNIDKTPKQYSFGYKLSEEFCQIMSINNVNTIFKILEISNNKILFEINLRKFCRDNNLSRNSLQATFVEYNNKGKYSQHKGWKILEKICIEQMLEEYKLTKLF